MGSEIWKPLVGDYPSCYEVSDRGRVRSNFSGKFAILSLNTTNGHHVVTIDGKNRMVQRLVIEAFTEKKLKKGFMVVHLDHNKQNNRLSNLKVVNNFSAVRKHSLDDPNRGEQYRLRKERQSPQNKT